MSTIAEPPVVGSSPASDARGASIRLTSSSRKTPFAPLVAALFAVTATRCAADPHVQGGTEESPDATRPFEGGATPPSSEDAARPADAELSSCNVACDAATSCNPQTGKCEEPCKTEADCPKGRACDAASHYCTSACSATSLCNGGCCNGGVCAPLSNAACGYATCSDCTSAEEGHACLSLPGSRRCGCGSSADCNEQQACDLATMLCTDKCSKTQPCRGGCCDLASGTCVAGTSITACGGVIATHSVVCTNCKTSVVGGLCGAGTGNFVTYCGACSTPADCAPAATCVGARCCLPTGTNASIPGDCCSSKILKGACL